MNYLLKEAISELNNLIIGDVFLVKDLFKGYKWNRIERADRLKLGLLFIEEIKAKYNEKIEILEKTSSNQQRYKKIA